MSIIRIHVTIAGTVQGVGYRYFVRELATSRDLSGWICNMVDGSVKIEAQGEAAVMEEFFSHAGQGPLGAYVKKAQRKGIPPLEGELGFEVLY